MILFIALGLVKCPGWYLNLSEALPTLPKIEEFLAKHRRVANVCTPTFANFLAALYLFCRFLYFVWKAASRRFIEIQTY